MLTHRVIFSDNGTPIDYSLEAKEGSLAITPVASEDFLLIGQDFPFNYIFFHFSAPNTSSSSLSVHYWDNNRTWRTAPDVLDATSTSGVCFASSGILRFSPDVDYNWRMIKDTRDNGEADELASLAIYNRYWIRIGFSSDLSATTIDKIGYKFTSDARLAYLNPDINEYLTAWKSGKTDWHDQIMQASIHVLTDLKAKGVINSQANILRLEEEIELLAAYRTLVLIYVGLGKNFIEQREATELLYNEMLKKIKPIVDTDDDALVGEHERRFRTASMVR